MQFSSRSKMSIMLSLVAIVTLFGTILATGAFFRPATSAHAASANSPNAVTGQVAKVSTVNFANLPASVTAASHSTHVVPYLSIHSKHFASSSSGNAPSATATSGSDSHPLLHNFNGISAVDSMKVNGFDVEPPDQGLCVGNGYVMEMVNLAVTIYHPSGTIIKGPKSVPAFFGEPPAFTNNVQGDPRCYYDPTTHAWFATQLFFTFSGKLVSHFDLAVNSSGNPTTAWTVYQFNTTDLKHPGCPCFGDQPLLGIDQFNVYVSTNEFSIAGTNFNGAQIYAISKSQLIALASKINFVHFSNLSIGGTIAASVQPAITNDRNANAEYFLNSLDPFATFDNRIGVWALTNRQEVSKGGIPTLTNVVIHSETYGQPPLATDPSGFKINTDDDRMQQVQYINGQLWSSLDTALTIPGESGVRSAAAWFEVKPFLSGDVISGAHITDQGYVFSRGNYLLYPAVVAAPDGTASMVMTLMGPGTFASAVFAVRPASSGHQNFVGIRFAAAGVTTDHGFTCTDPATGNICRWGDYSAAVIDPSGNGIWMATEYIPGTGDKFANWGTRVFEVAA